MFVHSMLCTLMLVESILITPGRTVVLVEVAYCSVPLAMNQLPRVCARHALKANTHLLEASARLVRQAPFPILTGPHVRIAQQAPLPSLMGLDVWSARQEPIPVLEEFASSVQLGTLPLAITLDAPNVLPRLGQNLEENALIARQARLPMPPTQDVRRVQ